MFEAYSGAKYNATGVIQWMLNNGLPSHIWHLFDWYLEGGGSYYGSQRAMEPIHPQFDAFDGSVVVVNSLYLTVPSEELSLSLRLFALNGTAISGFTYAIPALEPDSVAAVTGLDLDLYRALARDWGGVVLLRLDLLPTISSSNNYPPSLPNTYWLSALADVVDYTQCNFYVCNTSSVADYTALDNLPNVRDKVMLSVGGACTPSNLRSRGPTTSERALLPQFCVEVHQREPNNSFVPSLFPRQVIVENTASVVAFFVHVQLRDAEPTGAPSSEWDAIADRAVFWDDNFITLLPGEKRLLAARTSVVFNRPVAYFTSSSGFGEI